MFKWATDCDAKWSLFHVGRCMSLIAHIGVGIATRSILAFSHLGSGTSWFDKTRLGIFVFDLLCDLTPVHTRINAWLHHYTVSAEPLLLTGQIGLCCLDGPLQIDPNLVSVCGLGSQITLTYDGHPSRRRTAPTGKRPLVTFIDPAALAIRVLLT
jgi:hypothetical protein